MLKGEQKRLYYGTNVKQRKSSLVAASATVTHTLNSTNEGELENEFRLEKEKFQLQKLDFKEKINMERESFICKNWIAMKE
jgi:hypothetical protein